MSALGIPLQKTVAKRTYLQSSTSYLSSALTSTGPWMSAILSLALLDTILTTFLSAAARNLLFATITYAFTVSLVLASGPQAIVTRYLADRLYLKDFSAIAPTCVGALLCMLPVAALACPVILLAPLDWRFRFMAVSLVFTLSLIWMMMAFVSATRDRTRAALTIVTSYAVSLLAAQWLGRTYGLLGSLGGFTMGQVFCLAMLIGNVYLESPTPPGATFAFLAYIRKYGDLFIIGLLYASGIWADNAVYWFTSHATVIGGIFHTFPPYDIAKLTGYLLTIPTAGALATHMEKNFGLRFREYSRRIEQKGTYAAISEAKQDVVKSARAAIATVLKVQGIVALIALLMAPDITALLHIPVTWVPLLRIMVLAASANFLMVTGFLFLSYLDDRKATLKVLGVFVGSDVALTLATVWLNSSLFGVSYLLAGLVSAVLALYYVRRRFQRLEYITFMLQPMG